MFGQSKEKRAMDAGSGGKRGRKLLLAALLSLAAGGLGAWAFLGGAFEDQTPPPNLAALRNPNEPGKMAASAAKPLHPQTQAGRTAAVGKNHNAAQMAADGGALPALPKVRQISSAEDGKGLPVSLSSPETALALSELLSLKQLKQAQLAVKELDRKMFELDMPILPPVGQSLVAVPPPVPASAAAEKSAEKRGDGLPRIRSIKGFGGTLRAVLAGGGAIRDVGAGDSFQNGKITSISLHGVEFTAPDGSNHTLSFEE